MTYYRRKTMMNSLSSTYGMTYFEAFAYLRNRGFSEKELDEKTIPQVILMAEQKADNRRKRR
jgi:hypothetical protein